MTTKDIIFGPPENECCVCCDKCWDNQPLTANGSPDELACPQSCCTCPPLNDLCLTLHVPQCPTVDGMEFTLTKSMGVKICSGENIPSRMGGIECYPSAPEGSPTLLSGIQLGLVGGNGTKVAGGPPNEYEKWGFSGIICDGLTIDGCDVTTSGEKVKISLCCCDMADEQINATIANPADCHTCSYRLTFEWVPWIEYAVGASTDFTYCSCPSTSPELTHMVPICGSTDPITCKSTPWADFSLDEGKCPTGNPSPDTPFMLAYTLDQCCGWWNCDCCQNGYGPSDNTAELSATIVEGAGTNGACS